MQISVNIYLSYDKWSFELKTLGTDLFNIKNLVINHEYVGLKIMDKKNLFIKESRKEVKQSEYRVV